MLTKYFYRDLSDRHNNFACDNQFLSVNCAGHYFYENEIAAASKRQDYYLIYLCDGTLNITAPDVSRSLSAGDLILFSPETFFAYTKEKNVKMEYYWAHFSGYGCEEILKSCGLCTNSILSLGRREEICEAFEQLFSSFLIRDRFFEATTSVRLYTILLELGKAAAESSKQTAKFQLHRAISYIHSYLAQPISVADLAAMEHLSESRFRALFHSQTGLSPQKYIKQTKLQYACVLLRQTDLQIKEIAAMTGYYDPQYFSRLFAKHTNCSPLRYRKQPR